MWTTSGCATRRFVSTRTELHPHRLGPRACNGLAGLASPEPMVPSTFTTLRTALVLAATLIPFAASSSQTAQSADDRFRFGRVLSGTVITHQISVKNEGARPMRIVTVQLTPPLVVTRMPASIGPGLEGSVQLALDTSRLRGLFTG